MLNLNENKNALVMMITDCFSVTLNANDFFHYSTAEGVVLEYTDFDWAIPFIEKHGYDGINAVMCWVCKLMPIKPHQTEKFLEVYSELKELNPEVTSEQ